MDLLLNIAQFVLVLGLLLFFHELGHFLMSRLFRVEVEEFGFGFPPRIVRLFRLGGTDFTLNWIPFGAFVRPKGENDPTVPGGMASSSPWVRLGILLGGPAMNFLVGIILLVVLFSRTGMPNPAIVQVASIGAGSPAETAGLQAGDTVIQANGETINSVSKLQAVIQANLGKPVSLEVERQGQPLTISLTPRTNPPADQGPLGVALTTGFTPITMGQAVPAAISATADQVKQIVTLPARLAQGSVSSDEARMVGPKGIYDIYQEAGRMDAEAASAPLQRPAIFRLSILAAISIALGLTNLFPIPALDGGRILLLLPELILRRRIPPQYENIINLVGFAALLLLMVYITIQDFVNPVIQR